MARKNFPLTGKNLGTDPRRKVGGGLITMIVIFTVLFFSTTLKGPVCLLLLVYLSCYFQTQIRTFCGILYISSFSSAVFWLARAAVYFRYVFDSKMT